MSDAPTRLERAWERGVPAQPARLLAVAGGAYRGLLGTREWLYTHGVLKSRAVGCPVVAIGNLTVGGTGKTPATELAVKTLAALGRRPGVLSRGYGRRTRGAQIVADTSSIRLDAEEAGDEPFLLARRLPGVPVLVGGNRYEAARLAIERFGVNALVLDDAFQHRTLTKTLEILMARAHMPWGNGRLLPQGPLREPLTALGRAHLVVATGATDPSEAAAVQEAAHRHAPGVPVLTAAFVPTECWEANRMRPVALAQLRDRRLLAFAGIASPAGFAATLRAAGVDVAELVRFADHHWFSPAEMADLDGKVGALGAEGLVTTEKDWVRLRKLPPPGRPLYVLSIKLVLTSAAEAWQAAFERACSAD